MSHIDHRSIPCTKAWLLCKLDGLSGLTEIQRNDDVMLLATDADALRRARFEARHGVRSALRAIALHQRDRAACRAYRLALAKNNAGGGDAFHHAGAEKVEP